VVNDPDQFVYVVGVSITTARATMIPLPTEKNLQNMKENFETIPENVKKPLDRTTPKEDRDAMHELWEALGARKRTALGDNGARDGADGEKA